MAAGDRTCCAA